MLQAYKKFWLNYTNFSGCSSRLDYWLVYLCQLIILMPLTAVLFANMLSSFFVIFSYMDADGELVGITEDALAVQLLSDVFNPLNILIWSILFPYCLATMIPSLAIMSRCLRDAGFHWAFVFLTFVPYVNLVLLALPTKDAVVLEEPIMSPVVEESDDNLSAILSDLESSD